MKGKPKMIDGGLSVDDRGAVGYCNGFGFEGVKRFYTVRNHRSGTVRAWHAHRREVKYVTCVKGAALIGAVGLDDFERPSADLEPETFVLSELTSQVLHVPAGYANGAMTLTDDTILVYFSTATVKESAEDDHRYPARLWDCWEVGER